MTCMFPLNKLIFLNQILFYPRNGTKKYFRKNSGHSEKVFNVL